MSPRFGNKGPGKDRAGRGFRRTATDTVALPGDAKIVGDAGTHGVSSFAAADLVIPSHITVEALESYLEEIFHAWATPERLEVRRL